MNFFAIPTLKNARACIPLPISIMPLCSLNLTFDRERIGIARVGSLRCWAAVITLSATPTSFFSTAPLVFPFDRPILVSTSSCAVRVLRRLQPVCPHVSCVQALASDAALPVRPSSCPCPPARPGPSAASASRPSPLLPPLLREFLWRARSGARARCSAPAPHLPRPPA